MKPHCLAVAVAFTLIAAGCSQHDNAEADTATPTSTTSHVAPAKYNGATLRATAEQWVHDSNTTIGQDYTRLLDTYATPECESQLLALGTTNTSKPTRLVSVNEQGAVGTTVTALKDAPNNTGATVHWVHTDRWRFTCDGIFQ